MYSEKFEDIDNKPQYQVKFGDVLDVEKNIVSMAINDQEDVIKISTDGVNVESEEVDMGPPGYNLAFEIYLNDRTFTLYSNN